MVTDFILTPMKGHYSVTNVGGVRVLVLCTTYLMMFHICLVEKSFTVLKLKCGYHFYTKNYKGVYFYKIK